MGLDRSWCGTRRRGKRAKNSVIRGDEKVVKFIGVKWVIISRVENIGRLVVGGFVVTVIGVVVDDVVGPPFND